MRRVAAALALVFAAAPAAAFDTQAEAAYVVDYNTGTVLLEKNAHDPLPPSSMSKLMTLYMLFEALRDIDSLTLETRFPVSERAAAMGGSSMFLNPSDRPTVEELIRGIVVQSGNDATVV
ncbi:D-alanyl-D-alanine carboxypeptidase family protein, partial [Rhodosalinus sp.]